MIIEPGYAEQNIIEAEKYLEGLNVQDPIVRQLITDAFIRGRISSSGDLEKFIPKYNSLLEEIAKIKGLGL